MKDAARKQRNKDRLAELYPQFSSRIQQVINTLESKGIRPRIQDAWRSPADQLKAYLAHHSKVKYGFHNVTSPTGAPEALAVDMLDDDAPLNPGKSYLLQLAAAAEAAGLITGIRWDMPARLVKGIDDAIAAEDWNAKVKIGWDPTHIQPTSLTIADAKAGQGLANFRYLAKGFAKRLSNTLDVPPYFVKQRDHHGYQARHPTTNS